MESDKCRFCLKSFVNGRALGGHMRSHIHNFEEKEEDEKPSQLSEATESDVSSSSSENPTMDDGPKFEAFRSSVVLEDGESETNVIHLTRKRSKRTRKLDSLVTKKVKMGQLESESAASDTTEEEDLAFCLMMLSRDQWKKKKKKVVEEEEIEIKGYKKLKSTMKGRYKCETCGKTFKSYQALGGHRASHKKNRVNNKTEEIRETEFDDNIVVVVVAAEKRIHECPICYRVFASGQALGGHKRSHGIGSLSMNQVHSMESVKERMIDLNLPAPTEEDEVSVVFQ